MGEMNNLGSRKCHMLPVTASGWKVDKFYAGWEVFTLVSTISPVSIGETGAFSVYIGEGILRKLRFFKTQNVLTAGKCL